VYIFVGREDARGHAHPAKTRTDRANTLNNSVILRTEEEEDAAASGRSDPTASNAALWGEAALRVAAMTIGREFRMQART
jgi:hypothetical protein